MLYDRFKLITTVAGISNAKVLKKEYFIVNTNVQTKTQIDSESNL